jgi:hypothetical protein
LCSFPPAAKNYKTQLRVCGADLEDRITDWILHPWTSVSCGPKCVKGQGHALQQHIWRSHTWYLSPCGWWVTNMQHSHSLLLNLMSQKILSWHEWEMLCDSLMLTCLNFIFHWAWWAGSIL